MKKSSAMNPLKPAFLLFISLLAGSFLSAWAQGRDAFLQFRDMSVPSFYIEIPSSAEQASRILTDMLKVEDAGKPRSESQGFVKYAKIRNPRISRELLDIYFKVTESNVNDKPVATIYLLVSRGYDNFVNSTNDAAIAHNVEQLLNGVLAEVQRKNLLAEIDKQAQQVQAEAAITGQLKAKIDRMQQELSSLEQKLKKSRSELDYQVRNEIVVQQKLEALKSLLAAFEANQNELRRANQDAD